MSPDKYTALWLSHSSISDFLKCPQAYYLKNIYKSPKTGHKIQVMSPPLALGQAVHEVVESLSVLPTETRFSESLLLKYERAWQKVTGKLGGFTDTDSEHHYRERGEKMLQRVVDHPGPLTNRAIKIKGDLPWYWFSDTDNIILCGKIDWLEYLPETDSVHIIDFKTSRKEESPDSLQLPIYLLLATNTQKRTVTKVSYWYLESSQKPVAKDLPTMEESQTKIRKVAKEIKLARSLERFKCPGGQAGCPACNPFKRLIQGEGEMVGISQGRDVYILSTLSDKSDESYIL